MSLCVCLLLFSSILLMTAAQTGIKKKKKKKKRDYCCFAFFDFSLQFFVEQRNSESLNRLVLNTKSLFFLILSKKNTKNSRPFFFVWNPIFCNRSHLKIWRISSDLISSRVWSKLLGRWYQRKIFSFSRHQGGPHRAFDLKPYFYCWKHFLWS